jgi:hypothetical protein
MFEQGFGQRDAKNKMGIGDFKNLSGEKPFGKISDSLGGPLHFRFLHHCHLREDIFTVLATGAGGLIAVLGFIMFKETVQLPVIQIDQFPHLQVEDLFQFGDLHDVYMFRFDKVFEMDRGKRTLPRKGEKV